MTRSGPIAAVVVVGGGITASTAAAALKRRIPSLKVELVGAPVAPDALADRMISSLPSIHSFHGDIGLTHSDTIVGAASGPRLGSCFEGWGHPESSYIHAYGPCGTSVRGVPFHQLWLRDLSSTHLPPFDHFSLTAAMARAGVEPMRTPDAIAYGLQLSLDRYAEMMGAYAVHLGVRAHVAPIADVTLNAADGFIDNVMLADGQTVPGDLFVDCTGPASILHSPMGSPIDDWSKWLPCDRLAFVEAGFDPATSLMDTITALPFGWAWKASSPRRATAGFVYSSAHAEDTRTQESLGGTQAISIRQGRRRAFWLRNCVAIGDAAVAVEPLEWSNLHLVHSQVDRLIAMMPARDCAAIELAQFNRECGEEADRVRDFLCMHYVCSVRQEPFWKEASEIIPPASLDHTLSLFRERGRLPYYQEETFSRDSWLTVLLGQGVRPRRIDPLADLVATDEAAQAFAAMRRSLEAFTLPSPSPVLELNPLGIR